MLAHYIGGGVGHKGTRKYLHGFARDARAICDPADWEGENTELAQTFQAEMDEESEEQGDNLYDADEDSEEVQLILDEEEEAEWVQGFDELNQSSEDEDMY